MNQIRKYLCVSPIKALLNRTISATRKYQQAGISFHIPRSALNPLGFLHSKQYTAVWTEIWYITKRMFQKSDNYPTCRKRKRMTLQPESLVSGNKLPISMLSVYFQGTELPGSTTCSSQDKLLHVSRGICQLFISISKQAVVIQTSIYQGLK